VTGYFLSRDADEDLQDIYAYGEEVWGAAQAAKYLHELYGVFELVSEYPEIGRSRRDLTEALRSFVHGSHVVFYMSWQGEIAVVRVLHGSRDFDAVFDDYNPASKLER
jgi:toxin ParE1/3/4